MSYCEKQNCRCEKCLKALEELTEELKYKLPLEGIVDKLPPEELFKNKQQ